MRRASRAVIGTRSIPWVLKIDACIREYNIRGPFERFRDVASDALDSSALRSELDDLIRRRMLTVVRHGFDDSLGRDPLRDQDSRFCGAGWSVDPTPRMIQTFWPDRLLGATPPRPARARKGEKG